MTQIIKYSKPDTLLHIRLTTKQQVYTNYLIPVLLTSLIYIFNFTADSVLALQHRREENYFYGSITLLWMYAPVLTCFVLTVSNTEIYPGEGLDKENIKWLCIMILQHFFFPIWAIGRFAEQLFWSIEAIRCEDEELEDLLARAEKNCIFELYHFLQAYLQAVPQILFQLHIIFRQPANYEKSTVDMQVFSVLMSIIKMSMTTMSYQRFKSQKLAGRQYPWLKKELLRSQDIYTYIGFDTSANIVTPKSAETSHENDEPHSDLETSETEVDRARRNSGLSMTSSQFNEQIRVDPNQDQPDFILPARIENRIRALTQDDAAGKLVSFFWWFCFILSRMLALSAFAYFYPKDIWWICSSHYIITLGFLLYDARISEIPHFRVIFVLFTSYIFMFCLIEFKIKFKKFKFIYNGYLILVYLENFIMTSIWYYSIDFSDDWWYKYIFYLILISSMISAISMIMYITILKPGKIVVEKQRCDNKSS